jgi:putative ABC transport system ATP-binding protein
VERVLNEFQILHRRNHFPQQLSGGQQQRAAVARAVIAAPKLILADEPTGNLDSAHGQEVMDILESLNRGGTTIIMVTHSAACADRANRVLHLLDGSVVAEEPQR